MLLQNMGSCVFIFLSLFVSGSSLGKRELIFVTVLYRHGDRSPVSAYPTDPHQESAWPQGFGQLSKEGMQQHFELGKFLRNRYQNFLNTTYSRSEIAVRSTDFDRTLMSAASNLAGLYLISDSSSVFPNVNWQPIPIHTVPPDEKLLLFPIANCPRYQRIMEEMKKKSEIMHNITETYKDFIEMVRKETGLESTSLATLWSVYDTLFCEKKHNLSPPAWVTPVVMNTLKLLNDFSYRTLFGIYKREEKARLQGGVLLDQILKNISAAAKSTQHVKMIMYSAHDVTILALHEALNVYNGVPPPFAACHIFELYQEDNGSFSVEMYYRNDSSAKEFPLALPGCAQPCPLTDFINLTRSVISTDWDKDCQSIQPAPVQGCHARCSSLCQRFSVCKSKRYQRCCERNLRISLSRGP